MKDGCTKAADQHQIYTHSPYLKVKGRPNCAWCAIVSSIQIANAFAPTFIHASYEPFHLASAIQPFGSWGAAKQPSVYIISMIQSATSSPRAHKTHPLIGPSLSGDWWRVTGDYHATIHLNSILHKWRGLRLLSCSEWSKMIDIVCINWKLRVELVFIAQLLPRPHQRLSSHRVTENSTASKSSMKIWGEEEQLYCFWYPKACRIRMVCATWTFHESILSNHESNDHRYLKFRLDGARLVSVIGAIFIAADWTA